MAANRKFQQTVDATLRKIDEGIAEFGSVWVKCEESQNQNQRVLFVNTKRDDLLLQEKNQNDLKREIKKLQRLREEIMKWMSSSELKDKSSLIDARKRIEVEMERFKNYERESKTKPFSFMGLQMADKLDPMEQKKHEKRASLEDILEKLNRLSEEVSSFLCAMKSMYVSD